LLERRSYFLGERDGELVAYAAEPKWPILRGLTDEQRKELAAAVRRKIESLGNH
jgi:hypothetical protein